MSPNNLSDECLKLYETIWGEYSILFTDLEKNRVDYRLGKITHCDLYAQKYSKALLERVYACKDECLFPVMIRGHRLFSGCYNIFSISNFEDLPKNMVEYVESELATAYLDLIQLYWHGYLAFIIELKDGNDTFETFVTKCKALKPDNFNNNFVRPCCFGYNLNSNNFEEFLRSFIVYYALETCFTRSDLISTQNRVKALRIWKKYDSNYDLFFSRMCYYRGRLPNETIANVLPRSFDKTIPRFCHSTVDSLNTNPKFLEILGSTFGPVNSEYSLSLLLNKYQTEALQLCKSSLNLPGSNEFQRLILNFLLKIIDLDDNSLELYFGQDISLFSTS